MARKIKQQDLKQSANDAYTTLDGSLTKNDLQLTGDTTSVTAKTIPYDNTSLTPTIWDVLNTMVAGAGFVEELFTGDAITTDFIVSADVDTSAPCDVELNGQSLILGLTHDYTITTPRTFVFTFTPETSTEIKIKYKTL